MKRIHLITLIILFFGVFHNGNAQNPRNGIGILENDHIKIEVDMDVNSHNFGAIIKYIDKDSTSVENTWFTLHAGSFYATEKEIISYNNDSIKLRLSQFGTIPLITNLCYTLENNAVILDFKGWVTKKSNFPLGLEFDFNTHYQKLLVKNQGRAGKAYNLQSGQELVSTTKNVLIFYDERGLVTVFLRNPFHSNWKLNNKGKVLCHNLQLIHTIAPRVPYGNKTIEGPIIHSTISAYDTLNRKIEIHNSKGIQTPVFFSEHKNGWSQCLTMYWDELPNRDRWAFMTTADAQDVKYDHFWVRLMNEIPQLKMGYLVTPDRILFRCKTHFESWRVPSPFIFADSLEKDEGSWCVSMIAESTTTLKMYQAIPCKKNTNYTFGYRLKTIEVKGKGAYGEVYGSTSGLIEHDAIQTGTTEWHGRSFSFKTGKYDTTITIYLRIENASGIAFFDQASLTDGFSHTNLLSNGNFEDNDPRYVYDNRRRHWSDAHGLSRLSERAPQEYKDFLIRIENDQIRYGWEHRVNLGSHGYHHTPSLYVPDNPPPGWEFQHYDPPGDLLRITRIFEDIQKIGLTKKSLRYWRSPGGRYTKSLVDLLIDSGFVFMDPFTNDTEYRLVNIQRGNKIIWMPSLAWWADISKNNDPLDRLYSFLEQGHLGHIGGHPEQIFKDGKIEHYNRLKNIFIEYQKAFPNLGYVFPDEYADNASAIYMIKNITCEKKKSRFIFTFDGLLKKGNSIAFPGNIDNSIFNGAKVNNTFKDGFSFVVLPEVGYGTHTLELFNPTLDSKWHKNISPKKMHNLDFKYIKKLNLVTLSLEKPAKVSIRLYDVKGRELFSLSPIRFLTAGKKQIPIHLSHLSAGAFIFKLIINENSITKMSIDIK